MQTIYEPKGKAREYAELACNLYRGCAHRCVYCYAPAALHMQREAFAKPVPRPGILDALAKDAPKYAGKEVLLSFTCDPCQDCRSAAMSVQAIDILHKAGCRVAVLTKGGSYSLQLLSHLTSNDRYGATLTFVGWADSRKWEPNAAEPGWRMDMLAAAKHQGIPTWVSLEPVIDPDQSLNLIGLTAGIVDKYHIGRWNHDKRANEIDWADFARKAVAQCKKQGSKYVLKKDLAKELRHA